MTILSVEGRKARRTDAYTAGGDSLAATGRVSPLYPHLDVDLWADASGRAIVERADALAYPHLEGRTMTTILLVLLVILLLSALPAWPYSRSWGYGPSGLLGFLLVVFLLAVILKLF